MTSVYFEYDPEDNVFVIEFLGENNLVFSVDLNEQQAQALMKDIESELQDYWVRQHGMD